MRRLVLSDLHREIWCRDQGGGSKSGGQFPKIDLAISRPDVVILAGDIDVSDRAIAWADKQFDGLPVIYVHGNHEGYGHNLDEVERAITEACESTGHIHHLNRGELILGDTRFLGATLWTDFGLYEEANWKVSANAAGELMNDYRRIRLADQGHRQLTPEDTRLCHLQDRRWLEGKLEERFAGWTVVVTDMAPSEKSIAERFRGDSFRRLLLLRWTSRLPRRTFGYTGTSIHRWTTKLDLLAWCAIHWATQGASTKCGPRTQRLMPILS